MKILLDWVKYEFSDIITDVLIVLQDEVGYHLFTYEYDGEFVSIWYEQEDVNKGVLGDIKEPENSSEFYHTTVQNILKRNIL